MVKIYGESGASFSSMSAYVALEDYESLKSALGEAMNGWWQCALRVDFPYDFCDEQEKRIAALRKEFLDV